MSTVTILTLWGWRKSEEMPELMEAWDYFCVDENRDGWQKACDEAIASWGDDLYAHRYIDINVSLDRIRDAFFPPTIEGDAVPVPSSIDGSKVSDG